MTSGLGPRLAKLGGGTNRSSLSGRYPGQRLVGDIRIADHAGEKIDTRICKGIRTDGLYGSTNGSLPRDVASYALGEHRARRHEAQPKAQ